MKKNIFCIGGAAVDHKLKPLADLIPATSNPVESITTFGGVARNVAENLAHWTHNIHLQCVVGDDNDGKKLLTHLQKLNVDTTSSLILNAETAHYYSLLNHDGDLHIALADMNIYNDSAISIDQFTQSWPLWPDKSIIFIDTNLPENIIHYAIKMAASKQCLLCVDPVSVAKAKKLSSSLQNIFLIKPNQLEVSALTNMPVHSIADCIRAGKLLHASGVKHVIISLGDAGYVIVNAAYERHFNVPFVMKMIDANGAGDAFMAGILYGLQHNLDILHACELGASAAALTIQSEKTVLDTIRISDLFSREETKHAVIF